MRRSQKRRLTLLLFLAAGITWLTSLILSTTESSTPPELPLSSSEKPIIKVNYSLSPPKPCSQNTLLVVFVFSRPRDFAVRRAIRATWGSLIKELHVTDSDTQPEARLLFLMGQTKNVSRQMIFMEWMTFQDTILADFDDTFQTLNLKAVSMLGWMCQNCPHAFTLKTDSDMFIRLDALMRALYKISQLTALKTAFWGRASYKSLVLREGRYAVSRSIYPSERYPGYACGNAYVIPRNATCRLFKADSERKAELRIPNEDVYVSGILREAVGLQLTNDVRFTCHSDSQPNAVLMRRQLTLTNVSPIKMKVLWKIYLKTRTRTGSAVN